MSASVFHSEELASFRKTRQLTQLDHGTDSQELDISNLRSCDAFVPEVKEEVEDPDFCEFPTGKADHKPVEQSVQCQPPQQSPPISARQPVNNYHFNQMTHPYGYMPQGYYMMNGRPMQFVPRPMPVTRNLPGQVYVPQRVAHPQMTWPLPMNYPLPANVSVNQVREFGITVSQAHSTTTNSPVNQVEAEKEPGKASPASPVQQETQSQVLEPVKMIKEEPLDETETVPQAPVQQRQSPVLSRPIPQSYGPPRVAVPHPQMSWPMPMMGLPYLPTRLPTKRKYTMTDRMAKMMKEDEEDAATFIDKFKSFEVPSLVGKHKVLLYKFNKDGEDYCYPFTLKRTNRKGEVFSCSNCKQLRDKDVGILVKKGYFQADPTVGHGSNCVPNKWIEEVAKRMTYKTTQRVKNNNHDIDCREIHSQMCSDVTLNESLTEEEKDKVSSIIKNFPSKIRSIARARKMSKQRQSEEVDRYNEMRTRQMMMIYPHMMMPRLVRQPIPVVKIEEDS